MVHPLLVYVCGNALLLQQVEGLLGGEGIGGLLGIFGNLQLGGGSDVAAAGADAEGVGACLGEPLAACLVEAGKVAHGDGHRERLALTGLQLACLGEGLQFLCGLLQTTLGSLDTVALGTDLSYSSLIPKNLSLRLHLRVSAINKDQWMVIIVCQMYLQERM